MLEDLAQGLKDRLQGTLNQENLKAALRWGMEQVEAALPETPGRDKKYVLKKNILIAIEARDEVLNPFLKFLSPLFGENVMDSKLVNWAQESLIDMTIEAVWLEWQQMKGRS